MKWTKRHTEILERQIREMDARITLAEGEAEAEVYQVCKESLINLRRPVSS